MKINITGENKSKMIRTEAYAQANARLHKALNDLQRALDEFEDMGLTVGVELLQGYLLKKD